VFNIRKFYTLLCSTFLGLVMTILPLPDVRAGGGMVIEGEISQDTHHF